MKGAGFQTHGLRKFEFKAWIISSASVFHKTLCRRVPLESNCLMIPVVVGQHSLHAATGAHGGATPTHAFARFPLDGIPDSNSRIGHIQPKTSVKAPGKTGAESTTTGDLGPCFCQMARPCPCRAKGKVLDEVASSSRVLFPMTAFFPHPFFLATAAGHGEQRATIFFAQILLLVAVGRLLGEWMQRIGQPAAIGQLLAGIILGPSVFGTIRPTG